MTPAIFKLLLWATFWIAAAVPARAQAQQGVPAAGPTLDVQRYVVEGPLPLAPQVVREVLAAHLGEGRSLTQIEAAGQALEQRLREAGFPFHRVHVPAQRPERGEVRLQVVAIRLGEVEVVGNRHFSEDHIRAGLPALQEGQPPALSSLGLQLAVGNGNPARRATIVFRESRQPATVDAVVRVRDLPPQAFIVSGMASVGGKGSSRDVLRLVGTWQHANLWGRDHVATLSWGTDPRDVGRVRMAAAHYQVPLPALGLTAAGFFTHSEVDSGRIPIGDGFFDVSGSGRFIGLRLTRSLARLGSAEPTLAVGLEDRLFRNETTFISQRLQPDVSSRVLTVQASARAEQAWGTWSASLDWAGNLGGGSNNTDAAHDENQGDRAWRSVRWSVEAAVPTGGWQVLGRTRGQYSGSRLVSGEQFGIGGAQSVRGFGDRVAVGERGALLNLEAVAPSWGDGGLRPVFFLDLGRVRPRMADSNVLAAAGAGLRWGTPDWQVTLDLARVLEHRGRPAERGDLRLHLAVVARY
ncbi:ShlB/FhaC/HecB family hemolysin secretion/activation protein [Ramlibacter sp. AW1]|uniref:ShlB/FhaC/HecB family hemolysin secretion/activation protein n=1 Tax=Ramlibacter aurantiacus TaxID=2801330 RepID=A0A936ZN22_9BURK|nr:ShlB/FhaC/HecB family hemolysin secretion/activation protein [Ramlibacter aurantiacus]MBL0420318.1 ShlB/FhaC/HecB family hemolysin secretion/activation protein [Ramlibacter aurantiacus]